MPCNVDIIKFLCNLVSDVSMSDAFLGIRGSESSKLRVRASYKGFWMVLV